MGIPWNAGIYSDADPGEPTEKDPAIAIPGAFPFEAFAEEIDRMLVRVWVQNHPWACRIDNRERQRSTFILIQ